MRVQPLLLLSQLPSGTAPDSCKSEGNGGTENRFFPVLPQHGSCCSCAGVLCQRGRRACFPPVKKIGLVFCFPTVLCLSD